MAHHRAFGLRAPETKCKARPQAWGRPSLCRRQVESGLDVRTHPFAPYGRQRPGETPVRTALSPRLLIRMRSQVQVQLDLHIEVDLRRRSSVFSFDRGCSRESPGHSGLRTHPWAVMADQVDAERDAGFGRRRVGRHAARPIPHDKGTRQRRRRRVRYDHSRVGLTGKASTWTPRDLAAWEVAAMSVVTEHLEQRGSVFEVLPHRQAYTSVDEARALGIEVGEVLKTLAVRTGSGYALMVIPASRRLDLHLAREALGDNRARLASEEELGRDFPGYELGALPPIGALLDAQVYVDPEVLGHDTVTFAAGTQTESVKMQTQELFGTGGFTTVSLVKQPERGSDDRVW
jgi:Ala-tRNA(Pro) deacylase